LSAVVKELERFTDLLERYLPSNGWPNVLTIFALAAAPLLPFHYIARPFVILAIFFSLLTLFYVVVSSFLMRDEAQYAIDARRLGVEGSNESFNELSARPLRGIGMLALFILATGAVIVLSLSSVTYGWITYLGNEGPFGTAPSLPQTLLFYADHALKGMFFDVFEVFDMSLQKSLKIDAIHEWPFAAMLVVYRATMALLTLQLFSMGLRYLLAEKDQRLIDMARATWPGTKEYAEYQKYKQSYIDRQRHKQQRHRR
jgi:hypothetical protein